MKDALPLETDSDEEEEVEEEDEEEKEAQEKIWRTSLTDDDMWWTDSTVDKEFTGNARPVKREGLPALNRGIPAIHTDYYTGRIPAIHIGYYTGSPSVQQDIFKSLTYFVESARRVQIYSRTKRLPVQ